MEDFHEVHIVIAVLLYLDQQVQLWSTTLTEGEKQCTVGLGGTSKDTNIDSLPPLLSLSLSLPPSSTLSPSHPFLTLRCLSACSATSSSFLFHSTESMMLRQSCSWEGQVETIE